MTSNPLYFRSALLAALLVTSSSFALAWSPAIPAPLPPTGARTMTSPAIPAPLPPTTGGHMASFDVAWSPAIPAPLPPTGARTMTSPAIPAPLPPTTGYRTGNLTEA